MKTNRFILFLILTSILLAPNCATLTRKSTQKIPVTSQPPGAKIIVDGKDIGYAPLALKLRKKATHLVRIEQEGYNPMEIKIERKKSGIGVLAIAGDFFLGLAAGFAGDYLAWVADHKPDEEFGDVRKEFFLGCIVGWIGLGILDGNSSARYALTPREISVTLTKADGPPRVDTILVAGDDFQNVKWIRVHRD